MTRGRLHPPAADPDLLGWARLAIDATLGAADVVEAMHARIARLPFPPGRRPRDRTGGITGFVYACVRGTMRLAGAGVEAALAAVEPRAAGAPTARREALIAALNGLVGDHLAATGNPLAIPLQLRRGGRALPLRRGALARDLPGATGRVLVLVHGACMDDLRWRRRGHDHGAALERDLGFTAVYARYNSGRHVSTNGRELAEALEALLRAWPVPVRELVLLGHSMGGLVARSAVRAAAASGHAWPRRLSAGVFLGTPHHGAALERWGQLVDGALGVSTRSAPLRSLGRIRSAGITDLRHGSLADEDWRGRDRFARRGAPPCLVPLPAGVAWYAVAGLAARDARIPGAALLGDGLVPLASALGRHADPARDLGFEEDRCWVGRRLGHFDLLDHPEVYARLRAWLAPSRPPRRRSRRGDVAGGGGARTAPPAPQPVERISPRPGTGARRPRAPRDRRSRATRG